LGFRGEGGEWGLGEGGDCQELNMLAAFHLFGAARHLQPRYYSHKHHSHKFYSLRYYSQRYSSHEYYSVVAVSPITWFP